MTIMENCSTNDQRTKCEIYTRVMGYYRPVSHFNIGKKSEFYSRQYFVESKTTNELFNARFSHTCISPESKKQHS